ncbi:type II secretion system minor pseudopilin GspH [Marinobacter sp. X15-166B]|uniref:type II secretion system minor pseudopilin GspH n=1 Tax=Marinobacter sp. X15-166B TaxID=1897620 RepID=UPI00085C2CC1|nr:type II secretion system minor pseudopilin GspH [Marinobacter sp. X15-166B]OEY67546.1 type II secretion system protein GspH [Marinobacter sp. X15-166B]
MSASPRTHGGFTLIEILVVLVVVGLLAALAVANLGGSAQNREWENEVREIYLLMQTAAEQAILNNEELGWLLEGNSYRFVRFDDQATRWEKAQERLFRPRSLPEWLVLTPQVESGLPRLTTRESTLRPDVVFFSSGETTPFELQATVGRDTSRVHRIVADGIGGLEWLKPGDDEADR